MKSHHTIVKERNAQISIEHHLHISSCIIAISWPFVGYHLLVSDAQNWLVVLFLIMFTSVCSAYRMGTR